MASASLTATKLKGHRASVTCLQLDSDQHFLLSGSDDKTVRLWDLRTNRSTKCMLGCFEAPIEAVRFATSHIIYAACSNAIYSFDLRFDGVLTKEPVAQVSMGEGTDEINTIAINIKGDTLAAAMDSGVINILPIRGNGTFCENSGATRYKRLTRVHTNIVSSINFKKNNPRELLSGGFDYIGCVWEVDRGRPKTSVNFQSMALPVAEDAEPGEASNPIQMFNPPFVMSMNYMLDGRCVVAALGDGSLRIVNSKDLTYNTHIEAHHCMISGLYSDNCHIVTGGTDSVIHAYRLNTITEPTKPTAAGGKKKAAPAPLGNLRLHVEDLFTIQHDAKINAVAAVFDSDVATAAPAEPECAEQCGTSKGSVVEESAPEGLPEAAGSVFRCAADITGDAAVPVPSYKGRCKVYIADISNDITMYASSS